MKTRIFAVIGAIVITGLWSIGMVNATAQYRQSFIAPMLAVS
jgi:hypothetical protein